MLGGGNRWVLPVLLGCLLFPILLAVMGGGAFLAWTWWSARQEGPAVVSQ